MTGDFYCDEVLSGKTAVEKLIETDRVLAFHHTRPAYPVHIVVIPKHHVDSLLSLEDDALLAEMMAVIRRVAGQIVASHGACRVVTNLGMYQDSKHLHWHVISGSSLNQT
ncbi:MAG: HIT domain-containing protein [Anaerolineaceae bacterium]|nr:HIT domain-containing protein [Anaerolineaceae bacterium]